jgi:hypothetical protein
MDQGWEIHYIHRDVVDTHDGLIVLESRLNRTPAPEWVKYFISGPGHKSGDDGFYFEST